MKRSTCCLLAMACVALVLGCASTTRTVPNQDEYVQSTILPALRARRQLTETLRLQLSLEVDENGSKSEVRQIALYKRPDRFRLQALDPMNVTRVVVITKSDRLKMLWVREYEGIDAPLTDDILRRIFRLDIRVDDVRSAFLADPFQGDTINLRSERRGDDIVVTRPSGRVGLVDEITIGMLDAEPIVRSWTIRDSAGVVAQRTVFDDYRETDGILRPMDVIIERPGDGMRMRFRVTDAQANTEIADASFEMEFQPGAKVQVVP